MATRKLTLEELKREYEEAQVKVKKRRENYDENKTVSNEKFLTNAERVLQLKKNVYLAKKRDSEGLSKEDVAIGQALREGGMGGGTSSFEATRTVRVTNTQNTQAPQLDRDEVLLGTSAQKARASRAQFDKELEALEETYGVGSIPNTEYNKAYNKTIGARKQSTKIKTPAPTIIPPKNKETVTKLIEANPRSEKLQNVIKDYKEKYSDDFKDVNPIPLEQLSPEEQEKRKTFVRAMKDCNIPDSDSVGKVLVRANPCRDTTFDKMEAQMTNFFNKVNGPAAAGLDMTNEIRKSSKIMSRTMTTFVNKATGSLNDALEQSIGSGMGALKSSIYSKISRAFPVTSAMNQTISAQLSVAPAINGILDSVYCVGSKITDALGDTIADLLTAAVKNTTNTPACAVQEIMGAINNDLINQVDSLVTPQLDPLLNLLGPLGFKFDVKNFMTSGVNVMKKIESFAQSCDDRPKCPSSTKYEIGKGVMKGGTAASTIDNFSKMMKSTALSNKLTSALPGGLGDIASDALGGALPGGLSNLAAGGDFVSGLAAGGITGAVGGLASGPLSDFEKKYGAWNIFGSPLAEASGMSPCYTGNPTDCGGPFVEIIGGGGSGGLGKPILGKFIDKLDTEDIFADVQKTASIVGVEIADPGGGYSSDPVVAFNDKCSQGYGAFAKAHVDKNPQSPTYGQITSITMISTGENYPANDEEVPLFIDKVIIENAGYGYEDTDTLDDFELEIIDGRVTGGILVNPIAYNDLPELNINTATGVGAILRPIMSKTRPQGEVVEVIDCIGK